MSGLSLIQQFLQNNAARESQERSFGFQREMESQRSVNAASERAANAEAVTKNYRNQKEIDQEFAEKDDVRAGKRAVSEFLLRNNMDPQMGDQIYEVFEAGRNRFLAEQKEATQKAKTGEATEAFKGEKLAATKDFDLSNYVSQAQEGAFRAGASNKFAQSNPQALEAGMFAKEVAPAAALARANTMSVGPGEYLRRLVTGNPIVDSMFPPVEGQGLTQEKQTVMQNIGGMQFPTERLLTTPGSIKPVFSGKIPTAVTSAAPQPTGPVQQQAPVAPARRMPGRSSGGQPMDQGLPPEMLNAQPTEEQLKEEWVRKMLLKLYTEPKF